MEGKTRILKKKTYISHKPSIIALAGHLDILMLK